MSRPAVRSTISPNSHTPLEHRRHARPRRPGRWSAPGRGSRPRARPPRRPATAASGSNGASPWVSLRKALDPLGEAMRGDQIVGGRRGRAPRPWAARSSADAGVRAQHLRVGGGVAQLEVLGRELHVDQPPPRIILDLPQGARPAGDAVVPPPRCAGAVSATSRPQLLRVARRGQGVANHVLHMTAQVDRPGDHAGADQCLCAPGPGALRVVLLERHHAVATGPHCPRGAAAFDLVKADPRRSGR